MLYDDLDDTTPEGHVERCRRDFEATGNPLYAWEAWDDISLTWRSRFHDSLPVPEWLRRYFDQCSRQLIGLPMKTISRKPLHHVAGGGIRLIIDEVEQRPEVPAETGEGPGPIGHALGFQEGLAKAREHWGGPFNAHEQLALRVVEFMWKERLSLDAAARKIEEASSWGYSWRTVRRAVEGAQSYALRRMQDYLREAGESTAREGAWRRYSKLCRRREG